MDTTTLSRIAAIAEKHPDLGIEVDTFESLEGEPNVNTKVSYLYRDGCNNKASEDIVFAGAMSAQQLETVIAHLDEDGGFIPGQVGLNDLQPTMHGGFDPDMDHPFHDFIGFALTTEPAAGEDIADWARRFETVSWDQSYQP